MPLAVPDLRKNCQSTVRYPGQSMEYRLLGASGLEVSVLSFGTMTLGGEGRFAAMGNVQVEEARRLIEICFEAGVNLFDTADIYSVRQVGGSARPGAGRAPQGHRPGDESLRSASNPAPTRPGLSRATSSKPARRVSAAWEPITSISTRPTISIRSRRSTRPCARSTI